MLGKEEEDNTQIHVNLVKVTNENIIKLKRLNSLLFPVTYGEKFYKKLLNLEAEAYLAYYGEKCIGAVCFRRELINTDPMLPKEDKEFELYIMTLGVLSVYRQSGVGSSLLDKVLEIGSEDPTISRISLHVQVNNQGAIDFYKKFGFDILRICQNYYIRLDPPDAYVLYKNLS